MTSAAAVEPVGLSVDDTIRQTVRALRAARQADSLVMARTLGISRQSLYNRLNGVAPFLAAEIAGLAQFFGVPVSDFYNGIVRVGSAPISRDTDVDTRWYRPATSDLAPVIPLLSAAADRYRDVPPGYGSSDPESARADGPAVNDCAGTVNNANAA